MFVAFTILRINVKVAPSWVHHLSAERQGILEDAESITIVGPPNPSISLSVWGLKVQQSNGVSH